jgi:hypothetical protein
MRRCSGFAFPQIATADLDIAVVSQPPPPNPSFSRGSLLAAAPGLLR